MSDDELKGREKRKNTIHTENKCTWTNGSKGKERQRANFVHQGAKCKVLSVVLCMLSRLITALIKMTIHQIKTYIKSVHFFYCVLAIRLIDIST